MEKTKAQISRAVTEQASSHLLCLFSRVCVGPGQKPEDRFCWDIAQILMLQVRVVSIDAGDIIRLSPFIFVLRTIIFLFLSSSSRMFVGCSAINV